MTSRVGRRALALVVGLFVVTSAFTGVAAAEQRAGGTIVVASGETVSGLQAVGGTVVVRGTVNGDVEALAGSVTIAESGRVTGNVQAAAGSVRIAGTVDGNVQAAGGSLVVAAPATIGGNLEAGAGSAVLDGTVRGDVRVGADSIAVGANAVVEGDLVYDGDLTRAPGATVNGQVREDPNLNVSVAPGIPQIADWVVTVYSLVFTLVVGAILLLALPGVTETVATETAANPLRTAGAGLLALFGIPVALVLLLVTIVGIPLSILGLFLYAILLGVSFVWGEYALGAWLASLADNENRWLALLVGVLAVFVVGFVPILGGLVEFAVLLLGLGGVGVAVARRVRSRRADEESAA